MEPAYTTIQPHNLYNVNGLKLDYNPNVSPFLVSHLRQGASRPMHGLDGLGAVDLRPTVTFFTGAGAVSVIVDPTSLFGGSIIFPVVGSIPYDIDVVSMTMILHVPTAGDVAVPLVGGGGGGNYVTIPGLGDIPYEISFGSPNLPPSAMFSSENLIGTIGTKVLPLLAIAVGAWFFLKR